MIAQGFPRSQVSSPASLLISGLPRTWRTSRQVTITSSLFPKNERGIAVKKDAAGASLLQIPSQLEQQLHTSMAPSSSLHANPQEGLLPSPTPSPSTHSHTSHQSGGPHLSAYSKLLIKQSQTRLTSPSIAQDIGSSQSASSDTSSSSNSNGGTIRASSKAHSSSKIHSSSSSTRRSDHHNSHAAREDNSMHHSGSVPSALSLSPKQLTSLLADTVSLTDLWTLHQQHHANYDHINACTAVYRLAHLANTATDVPVTSHASGIPSSTTNSLSSSGHTTSSGAADMTQHQIVSVSKITTTILTDAMQTTGRNLRRVEPDTAATLLWSLAQLRYTERLGHGRRCPTVEVLAQTVAHAAVVEQLPGPESSLENTSIDSTDSRPQASSIQPQHVVMAVWAIAKLGVTQRGVWDSLVPLVLGLQELKSRDVANMMWALATVNHPDSESFNHLSSRAVKLLADCNGQDLSSMVWAMARAKQPHPPLLAAAQLAILALPVQRLTGQNAANLLWGFATLDVAVTAPLLQHLALVARMRAPGHMTGGHLAQILWASVHLGVCNAEMLSAASSGLVLAMQQSLPNGRGSHESGKQQQQQQQQQAGLLTAREVCMAAWAAATLGLSMEDDDTNGAFVRQLQRSLCGLDTTQLAPQGVVMALWSLAKMRAYDQDLFNRLAASMKSNVYNYEAQQLSMVLWALATTGHRSSPTAIVAAAASVESILPRFNPQELAVVASSLAELGCYSPTLFDAIALQLTELHGLTPQEMMQQQQQRQSRDHKLQHRKNVHLQWQQQQHQKQQENESARQQAEQDLGQTQGGSALIESSSSAGTDPAMTSLLETQQFRTWNEILPVRANEAPVVRARLKRGGRHQLQKKLRPDLHRMRWSLVNRLKPMEVAKVLWAYASVGHVDETLFESLTLAVSRMLRAGDQVDLNLKTAAAAQAAGSDVDDHPDPETSRRDGATDGSSGSSNSGRKGYRGSSSDGGGNYRGSRSSSSDTVTRASAADHFSLLGPGVSRLLWAYATLGHQETPVFSTLVRRAVQLLPSLTPQDVAAVTDAVSMSGQGEEEERLVYGCVGMLLHRPDRYSVSQSVSVLQAAATVSIDNKGLITHVTQQMKAQPRDLSPRSWCDALHALMMLKHHDATLMDLLLCTHSLLPAVSPAIQKLPSVGSRTGTDTGAASAVADGGESVQGMFASVDGGGNSASGSSSGLLQTLGSTVFSPSQLVTVLTCLCSFSHPHTAFLVQAARFLISQLDLLMVDELISLAWVYGMAILPRPPNPVSITQALASNHKHLPAICSAGNGVGGGGDGGDGLQAVLELLRAIRSLVAADKPDTLLRPELMLLAQATIAAGDWAAATASAAAATAATEAEVVSVEAAALAEADTGSAAALPAAAMAAISAAKLLRHTSDHQKEQLEPLHLPRAMHVAALGAWGGRARQGGARRLQIEIATALTAAGYTAAIDVRSEDDCVPMDVEGEMGDRRVALVLMGGKGTNATGQRATSQRQVAVLQAQVAMLRLRGYWVFDMQASTWAQLKTPERKLAYLKQQLPLDS